MAVLNVLSNGIAPAHAQIGDVIRTAGGNFRIVAPNTQGATYNPASGRWSVKDDTPEYMVDAKNIVQGNQQTMTQAAETANTISRQSSAAQYAFNAEEAQKNRDWQERMSNTSHQREVEDLIAAGLNPVLSSTLGGASTPSGATASGGSFSGQKSDVDTGLMNIVVSMLPALLGAETQKDVARINAETALQAAKISSAASMYNADQSAAASRYSSDRSAESSNFINRLVNSFFTGNSGSSVSGSIVSKAADTGKSVLSNISDIFKDIPDFLRDYNNAVQDRINSRKK